MSAADFDLFYTGPTFPVAPPPIIPLWGAPFTPAPTALTWRGDGFPQSTPVADSPSNMPIPFAGTPGNDVMYGLQQPAGGIDFIIGLAGNDLLFGGPGNDLLVVSTNVAMAPPPGTADQAAANPGINWNISEGGPGDDVTNPGAADDIFYFGNGSGADTIINLFGIAGGDFNPMRDIIAIQQNVNGLAFPDDGLANLGSETAFHNTQVTDIPGGVRIDLGQGNIIEIRGPITKASLTPQNFIISAV